jgi:hypothetical protein
MSAQRWFPERARLIDGPSAFCGLFSGLLLWTLPAALVGAFVYWKLTRGRSKMKTRFSFFGGLLGRGTRWDKDNQVQLRQRVQRPRASRRLGPPGHPVSFWQSK